MTATSIQDQMRRKLVDRFYAEHGPCCAGCDHWRYYNSIVGECTRSAPVPGAERWSMLGISAASLPLSAGHVMTERGHVCGEFIDTDGVSK